MRAHYYRLLIDTEGNLVSDCTVRVLVPGTTNLIPETLYADDTTATAMANPFLSSDGQVNFYLDQPRRVRLGISAPDTPEKFYENVDVLGIPPAETEVFPHEHEDDASASVRLGAGSTVTDDGGTALGDGATAGQESTAVGHNATAEHVGATAVGSNAVTTRDNQVMVGDADSFTEFPTYVILKGSSGERYEVRIDDTTDPANPRLTFTAAP